MANKDLVGEGGVNPKCSLCSFNLLKLCQFASVHRETLSVDLFQGERFMQQLADLGIAAEEPETGWSCWLVFCVWEINSLEVSLVMKMVLGFFGEICWMFLFEICWSLGPGNYVGIWVKDLEIHFYSTDLIVQDPGQLGICSWIRKRFLSNIPFSKSKLTLTLRACVH